MRYTIILEPIEDGWWLARAPEIQGGVTQGESVEEALENVRDVIEMALEDDRPTSGARVATVER